MIGVYMKKNNIYAFNFIQFVSWRARAYYVRDGFIGAIEQKKNAQVIKTNKCKRTIMWKW